MNKYTNNSIIIHIFVCILIQISLIIFIPVQEQFCQFLENGNSYRAEIFRV